jgi:hypothetical protein
MKYVYVSKTSPNCGLTLSNDELYELSLHLNNYKNMYGLPKNICIHPARREFIKNDFFVCDYGLENYKKKLLIYIIFQTSGIITFYDNKIECEPNTIIIFPSEWFFPFKISQCVINIGNVFVDI